MENVMNFNLREGDDKDLVDQKVGLAAVVVAGHVGIAAGELAIAAKVAKSDMGTVTKWLAVTSIAGHAASLMKSCLDKFFGTEKQIVYEESVTIESDDEDKEEEAESKEEEPSEEVTTEE